MKRAVITGATGMIGATLIKKLLSENIEVLAIVRPQSKKLCNLSTDKNLKIAECSLSNLEKFDTEGYENYDVFYHFAWDGAFGESRNDAYLQNRNIKYTLDAVTLAKKLGCNTFIGAGSQAEYGRAEGLLSPTTRIEPENGYGIAKYGAGKLSAIYAKQLGLKHIWTRILSIYGPMDNSYTMIMSAINQILEGKAPKFTKGEQLWDYLYSEDAAEAFYLLGEKGKDQSVYCIGSGKTKHLYEYINILKDNINSDAKIGLGEIPYSEKQVMYLCADISNLFADTGFMPKTDFKDGIKKTIEWVKREKGNEKD